MIKQLLVGLLTVVVSTASVAQQKNAKKSDDSEDVIHKGVNTINVYYGVSIAGSIYKNLAENSSTDLKLKSMGPIGLVYEHLMTDVIGLGAEIGYSQLKMTYNTIGTNPTTYQDQTYRSEWKFTTIRAMVRINFHFAHSEHFDAYGLISAGYRNSTFSFTSDDPNYGGKTSFNGIIPFGLKPGLGIRYFFTDNIGLNLEVAAGTPLLCGGLSFKF